MEKIEYEFTVLEIDKVYSSVTFPVWGKGGWGSLELKFRLAKLHLAIDHERKVIYIPSCDLEKLLDETN